MARRRGQRSGWLRAENGSWLLTYRIYIWDPEAAKSKPHRETVTIGPAPNPETRKAKNGELTRTQAERFAWQHYLAPLDNSTVKPFSTMTLRQFWEQRYKTHLERKKKYATQVQYKSIWKCWIDPVIGDARLFELKPDQVNKAIDRALAKKKGTGTAGHIKKVIGAVIEHARILQMFTGENPAQLVELPEHVPVRKPRAMTLEQCRQWLAGVTDRPANPKDRRSDIKPLRTMSLLGICCSLGTSEQMGLQWRHINLTNADAELDGTTVEPLCAAIREHCYHGRQGTLKTGNRVRNIPLPLQLVESLKALLKESKWKGPDDPVFASETGKPIWADNLVKREIKPLAKTLGMPWLSPHVFRHTCATLTKTYGMLDVDRKALMGHSNETQTAHYTHEDLERMRIGVQKVADEITKKPVGDAEPAEQESKRDNVIEIRRSA